MLNTKLPYDPAIPLLGINPKDWKQMFNTCTLMFVAALFTIIKGRNSPSVYQQKNGQTKCSLFI